MNFKKKKIKSYRYIGLTDENTSLMNHQLKVYNYLKNHWSLIVFHKMGSGKTISSLYAGLQFKKQFGKSIVIIGPKSSKKSFEDDYDKLIFILSKSTSFGKMNDSEKFEFYTFQKAKRLLKKDFDLLKDKTVIIDEAHHLRSETKDMMFIINCLPFCYKLLLLTGTPVINHPVDLCVLVNIAKKSEVVTTDRELFDFYYVDKTINITPNESYDKNNVQIKLKSTLELKSKLSDCISYYEPKNISLKINTFYPNVDMNHEQMIEYKNYIVRLINPFTRKIVHLETDINNDIYNVDFKTLDVKKANAFLTATRQLSNTINNDQNSPKIVSVVETILKGPKPAIVYSNFLSNGIYPISVKLTEYGISHAIIKGSTSEEKMKKIINKYNLNVFDVLLISSAASESITLLGTRQIHILEPHFNEAKINQVIGRAIRYKSHDNLPKSEQNISIYHWTSVFPTMKQYKTADEYLINLGKRKQNLIDKFIYLVKETSI